MIIVCCQIPPSLHRRLMFRVSLVNLYHVSWPYLMSGKVWWNPRVIHLGFQRLSRRITLINWSCIKSMGSLSAKVYSDKLDKSCRLLHNFCGKRNKYKKCLFSDGKYLQNFVCKMSFMISVDQMVIRVKYLAQIDWITCEAIFKTEGVLMTHEI